MCFTKSAELGLKTGFHRNKTSFGGDVECRADKTRASGPPAPTPRARWLLPGASFLRPIRPAPALADRRGRAGTGCGPRPRRAEAGLAPLEASVLWVAGQPRVPGYTPRTREPPWEPVAVAASGSERGLRSTPLSHGRGAPRASCPQERNRGGESPLLQGLRLAQIYSRTRSGGLMCAPARQSQVLGRKAVTVLVGF